MTSIANSAITIQTSSQSVPSTPCRFGEVAVIAHYLRHLGILAAICAQVRFARRRFGRCEVIDFLAVLVGYAVSGERTLEAFYEPTLTRLATRPASRLATSAARKVPKRRPLGFCGD